MAPDAASTQQSEPVDVEQDLADTGTHYSLSRAVHARKAEYVRPHRIRIKVGSWNVAACPGTDKDLASWFVEGRGLEPQFDTQLANLDLKTSGVIEESDGESQHVERDPDGQDARGSKSKDGKDAYVDISPRAQDKGQEKRMTSNAGIELEPKSEVDETEPHIRLVGGSDIGLYVLGLQEIISLNIISGYGDTSATAKWQAALEAAMPPSYKLVASQQLSGLLLLIYASPDVAATISNVSTVSVGTGLLGYMGNKGGVSTRLVLGEATRLVFTDCHLASGNDQSNLERRYWDYYRILSQTQFSPINYGGVSDDEGETIGDEDFAFWFGDLNFRLDGLPGDDIRRLLMLHTRGEYDLNTKSAKTALADEDGIIVMHNKDEGNSDNSSSPGMLSREESTEDQECDEDADLPDPDDFVPDPHDDPASLQATLDSLLPHDQLARTIKDRKAFHEGWREGSITFLPSYKYDVGTIGLFDSSEKRRAPSWCDRILYRTRTDLATYKNKVAEEADTKKKDDEMKKRGLEAAVDDESVLFDYDPDKDTSSETDNDGINDYDECDEAEDDGDQAGETVITSAGFKDRIKLELYTTHQRITSSDHKPIVAVFSLDYDAVVPELKAKVHAEVAKELDRAENESRPGITIVLDGKGGVSDQDEQEAASGSGGVDFGGVAFLRPVSRSLTIANTGRAPATLTFVDKPDASDDEPTHQSRPGPTWLSVTLEHSSVTQSEESAEGPSSVQMEVTLDPGETASAVLTVSIKSLTLLQSLNSGTTALEDILVLRVIDGRDHFIPIRASWKPSCCGRSIEELVRIPPRSGGIRGFIEKLNKDGSDSETESWQGGSLPERLAVHAASRTELYRLTEAIESLTERVVADENMLQEARAKIPREKVGWPFTDSATPALTYPEREPHYAALIEALDTDDPGHILDALPKAEMSAVEQLEIVADVLILFLRSLTDGIVTWPLLTKIEASLPAIGSLTSAKTTKETEDDKSIILDVLSSAPYHNISFVFITSMLSKVASEIEPLNNDEIEVLNQKANAKAKTRSLSFRKSTVPIHGTAKINQEAIEKRVAWERKVAAIFGPAVCRSDTKPANSNKEKERERKTIEERMRYMIEIFLRRRDGH